MYNIIIINVDELWLKGKNRPYYFGTIRSHIKESLKANHQAPLTCVREEQRLVAKSETPFSEKSIQALLKIPGIHSLMPARRIPVEMNAIFPVVREELQQISELPATFRVETKRSFKGFPLDSMEVSRDIGELVLKEFPAMKVNLKNPQLVIEIRIMRDNIYLSIQKLYGIGGLPMGTSGHLVTMISGGFDSPVASFLMSKRGCRQTFIFFYAYPYVGDEVKEKVLRLVQVLGQYQRYSRLYVVGFGEIQNLISDHCREEYRTLLFRRAMVRCSALLAKRIKGDALLTGDALGQVSSQAIRNIPVLDKVSSLPIFRPLLGFNKIEIIQLAKKIGTHDISVIPHDDACSLFAPKHPIIKPSLSYLEQFDRELPLDEHLEKCLNDAEIHEISLTGKTKEIENKRR